MLEAAVVVITVLLMEMIAFTVHRYWMHGAGWRWHRSHHERSSRRRFERNDLFAVVFAAIALLLMVAGRTVLWPLYWVGIGMTLYGLIYAVVHDGLVHQRWVLPWRPRHAYFRRLIQAHRLHHAVSEREGSVSFGFLYAPPVSQIVAQMRARRPADSD